MSDRQSALLKAARECADGSDSIEVARDALIARLKAEQSLMDELINTHLPSIASALVRRCFGNDRRDPAWPSGATSAEPSKQKMNLQRVHEGAVKRFQLLESRLPNTGRELQSATKSDVLGAADYYRVYAKTYSIREKWLGLIAGGMQDNDTVGTRYNEAQLEELKQKVETE